MQRDDLSSDLHFGRQILQNIESLVNHAQRSVNLLIANRLGLLTPANLEGMKRGKSPVVTFGPYAGEIAEVVHILPVAKFPQYGKEFWNLELMPQTLNRRKSDKVGQGQMDLLRRVGQ